MLFFRIVTALVLTAIFTIFVLGGVFLISLSPRGNQETVDVNIERGATLYEVAQELKEAGVVRSAFAFQNLVLLQGGERDIVSGSYRFSEPESSFAVASRLTGGRFQNDSQGVTFPEGTTVQEMAEILVDQIPDFDSTTFVEEASEYEGYLFPDTYYFHSDVTPDEVIGVMRSTFEDKVEGLVKAPAVSERSLYEIVTMASIIEEEATDLDSRRIVSGILWSRLEQGTPLQVDAAFLYIDELSGKNTYSLTTEDLAIESPYNTYVNNDLPPTPITNPGLESIRAAANPINSDYKFYLSDTRGNMYYAETFDGHKENRKFLDY